MGDHTAAPEDMRERQRDYQARAAELQGRIGLGMVSAGTSNDWLGAYCIVDFDTLDVLLAERQRDKQRIEQLAEALEELRDEADEPWVREVARDALAAGEPSQDRETPAATESDLRTPEQWAWIRDRYKPDGLRRLARASRDYAELHGLYLPDVAALAYAEWERAETLAGLLDAAVAAPARSDTFTDTPTTGSGGASVPDWVTLEDVAGVIRAAAAGAASKKGGLTECSAAALNSWAAVIERNLPAPAESGEPPQ